MTCDGVVLLCLLVLLSLFLLFLLLPMGRWVMVVLISKLMALVAGQRMM